MNSFLIELLKKTRLRKPLSSNDKKYYSTATISRGDGSSVANNPEGVVGLGVRSLLSFDSQKQNNIVPGSIQSNPSNPTVTYINTENSIILNAENNDKLII